MIVWKWLRRYWLQDVTSTAACLIVGLSLRPFAVPVSLLVLLCLLTEYVAFYGVAALRRWQTLAESNSRPQWRATLHSLVQEYGAAEALDVLFRPMMMGAAAYCSPHPLWGIIVGSCLADVTFYGTAMLSYKLTQDDSDLAKEV